MTPDQDPRSRLPSAELIVEPPAVAAGNQLEYGCRLVDGDGSSRRIWFRFPSEQAPLLTSRADPFVLATLIYVHGRFGRLHIHGTVSEGLFPNIVEFQNAYAAFHGRRVAPTEFSAAETGGSAGSRRSGAGITAFSGGVDSCFSVLRHTALSSLVPKRPLGAALMMQGFDIPLEDTDVFARAAERAKWMTDDGGLRLFTGATNVRTLPGRWDDTFGTAVAAALSFFQPAYAFGLIPSFQEWTHAHFDHGSNPLMDPLLSSTSFSVVHDGASYGRIDKLRHLAVWPGALRHLRVCWEGDRLDANCCRCEKCLRTMLMLRLCGIDRAEAFPLPVTTEALDRLVIRNHSGIDEFDYLLAEAHRLGLREPWIKPTARALRRNRRREGLRQRRRALANLLPSGVREVLRKAGGRWLASPAARPPQSPTEIRPASASTR